ncbi:MAG: hypothetical protein JWP11_3682 [Frankiales bacterium]|nr:hypothetical protein [Frankiales bacterium]
MPRSNHSWDPSLSTRDPDGRFTARCRHCLLEETNDWLKHDGRVYEVRQWRTPTGQLMRIRPLVAVDAPKDAPALADTFPDVEVGGVPPCPKTPDGWASVDAG